MDSDLLLCRACGGPFQDPRLLPCSHTLCLACIKPLAEVPTFLCRVCGVKVTVPPSGPTAFPVNVFAISLAQMAGHLRQLQEKAAASAQHSVLEAGTPSPTRSASSPGSVVPTTPTPPVTQPPASGPGLGTSLNSSPPSGSGSALMRCKLHPAKVSSCDFLP